MKMLTSCRFMTAFLACLMLAILLGSTPLAAQEGEDSQLFLAGFNAYQQKNYPAAIARLDEVLQKHPETPLRDMTLFWLARSHYKAGQTQTAARYMAQFTREYPDNPLKNTVEEDLLALAAQHEKNQGRQELLAVAKRESDNLKAAQTAEQKRIDEAEKARLLKSRSDADRLAREKSEADRQAAIRREGEQKRAAAEAERVTREKTEADRLAALKAQQQRLANQKVAEEAAQKTRILKAKAEAERMAREKAEAERMAATKRAEDQRLAALTAEKQKQAALKTENERIAREKAEADRLAAAKRAEEQRLAALTAGQQKQAALKAEQERLAQQKASDQAAEKARILKAKAEADRLSREKAEADRLAAAKRAEEQRQAALAAEQQKQATLKAENDRKALEAAAAERQARIQAEQNRIAREKAAADKLALQKAVEERRTVEAAAAAAAARQEQERAAAQQAETKRVAAQRAREERASMKEKAVAEYKRILERFPGTAAARTAANRLKDLGIAVALPVASAATAAPAMAETIGTAQVLTLEVAQYAAFEFDLQPPTSPVEVARRTSIPFEIQNRGNGHDSFYLASSFPAEFGARFTTVGAPEQAINQTPLLAAGERFRGLLHLTVPANSIDGLRMAHPVKAASQFMGDASQSRVVPLVAAAPLLRAVVKTDRQQALPGEKLQYRITVMNVGSTPAQDVTLRINYPAQYQPADSAANGFRQEMDAALVLDGIALKPGESRDLTVGFQIKPEALAREELMVRTDLINNPLQTRVSFLSNATFVLPVSELTVKLAMDKVKAVPGQTVSIPGRITNKGNQRERISLVATSSPLQKVILYHDLNRDGLRQPGEPEVSAIGPLGPKEEAALLIEVTTPRNALDGAMEKITLTAAPEAAQGAMVTAEAQITYSRPMLQLTMKGREGRMVPGELLTVELDVLNRGSNLAKLVDLEISWPEQVELVAADQVASNSRPGMSTWRFNELGAGEKRTIKASFRIKSGTGVGTGVQLKSVMTYQDHAGNRY